VILNRMARRMRVPSSQPLEKEKVVEEEIPEKNTAEVEENVIFRKTKMKAPSSLVKPEMRTPSSRPTNEKETEKQSSSSLVKKMPRMRAPSSQPNKETK
jgi:hypothetical protein